MESMTPITNYYIFTFFKSFKGLKKVSLKKVSLSFFKFLKEKQYIRMLYLLYVGTGKVVDLTKGIG